MPLRLPAAILSRMRLPATSRSNRAKDNSALSISRPIELVALNSRVTDAKGTLWRLNASTLLEKPAKLSVMRSILQTATLSIRTRSTSAIRRFSPRRSVLLQGNPGSS